MVDLNRILRLNEQAKEEMVLLVMKCSAMLQVPLGSLTKQPLEWDFDWPGERVTVKKVDQLLDVTGRWGFKKQPGKIPWTYEENAERIHIRLSRALKGNGLKRTASGEWEITLDGKTFHITFNGVTRRLLCAPKEPEVSEWLYRTTRVAGMK